MTTRVINDPQRGGYRVNSGRPAEPLDEFARAELERLVVNPTLTCNTIAEMVGCSSRTVRRERAKLRTENA